MKTKTVLDKSLNLSGKFSDSVANFIGEMLCLIAAAGICVFGYQVCFWLMHGHWKPLPATMFLVKITPDNFWRWLADDTAWVGLKKIIANMVNMSLGWFLISLALILTILIFSCFAGITELLHSFLSKKQIKTKSLKPSTKTGPENGDGAEKRPTGKLLERQRRATIIKLTV